MIRSVHPSDEKNMDYLNMLKTRDTLQNCEDFALNTLRGILKYGLREEDNPQKNIQHMNRFALLKIYLPYVQNIPLYLDFSILIAFFYVTGPIPQSILVRVHLPLSDASRCRWSGLHPLHGSVSFFRAFIKRCSIKVDKKNYGFC